MNTLADVISDTMNDRDIMLLLGRLRSYMFDLDDFKGVVDKVVSHDSAKDLMIEKVDETIEYLARMQEEAQDIYYKLDIKIDHFGYYPVLFRGNVKEYKFIPMDIIDCDNPALSKAGFQTAQLVRGRIPIPPIKLISNGDGHYRIKDGRHRWTAFRLNGLDEIPAIVHEEVEEDDSIISDVKN